MKPRKLLLFLPLILASCSISQPLTTPSTPLTYGWVMVDNGLSWGVQIGPKTDAAGSHVAVYAWSGCTDWTSEFHCTYHFFARYETVTPGSAHDYAIIWGPGGWHLSYDGREVAVISVGSATSGHQELNVAEATRS